MSVSAGSGPGSSSSSSDEGRMHCQDIDDGKGSDDVVLVSEAKVRLASFLSACA